MPFDLFEPRDQQLQLLDVADELRDCLPLAGDFLVASQVDAEVERAGRRDEARGLHVAGQFPLDVGRVRQAEPGRQVFHSQRRSVLLEDAHEVFSHRPGYLVALEQVAQLLVVQVEFDCQEQQSQHRVFRLLCDTGLRNVDLWIRWNV